MSKTINIIIAETSCLLFEGLVQIIAQSGLSFQPRQAASLVETEKLICTKPDSLVIINPGMVQHNLKDFNLLKSNWENVKWIGLIASFFDPQILSLFDDTVGIYDTPGTIAFCIKKVLSTNDLKKTETSENVLSDRETDVLRLLAAGFSNKEVADKLNISVNTAITHRKNISQKTGIKTISGLTIYAVINKFITLENI